MGTNYRPRGFKVDPDDRIQCYTSPEVMEWIIQVCNSRSWYKSYLGTQALIWYFPLYNYAEGWVSIDDLLAPVGEPRNEYLMAGYGDKEYRSWLDSNSTNAKDYLRDYSPDNLERIKNLFSGRLRQRRGKALEFYRALVLYMKICLVNPDILNINGEAIRAEGFEYAKSSIKDIDYMAATGAKMTKLLGIDPLKPPKEY